MEMCENGGKIIRMIIISYLIFWSFLFHDALVPKDQHIRKSFEGV